jgi:release factor glutamine methyltransferase
VTVSSASSSAFEPGLELGAIVERLRASGCVFAEDEAALIAGTARDAAELAAMVEQRVAGQPLEYVVGWASFHGLRIAVDPGVFVPRRRTEFLVDEALRVTVAGSVVVDLCCGAGALGAAIAAERAVSLYAADIEPAAVRCARRNLPSGTVFQGDLFAALPSRLRGQVDVLLANVPYVPTDEIRLLPPEARLYEPQVTLDGGPDGLAVLRRVAAGAAEWLAPGGHLFVEMSDQQALSARSVMVSAGLAAEVAADDDLGANVVHGIKPDAGRAAGTPAG